VGPTCQQDVAQLPCAIADAIPGPCVSLVPPTTRWAPRAIWSHQSVALAFLSSLSHHVAPCRRGLFPARQTPPAIWSHCGTVPLLSRPRHTHPAPTSVMRSTTSTHPGPATHRPFLLLQPKQGSSSSHHCHLFQFIIVQPSPSHPASTKDRNRCAPPPRFFHAKPHRRRPCKLAKFQLFPILRKQCCMSPLVRKLFICLLSKDHPVIALMTRRAPTTVTVHHHPRVIMDSIGRNFPTSSS
jgi:hypothetical protein